MRRLLYNSHGVRKICKIPDNLNFHLLKAEHGDQENGWSHPGFLPSCPSCLEVVNWKHAVRDFRSDSLFRNGNPTPSTKMLRVCILVSINDTKMQIQAMGFCISSMHNSGCYPRRRIKDYRSLIGI